MIFRRIPNEWNLIVCYTFDTYVFLVLTQSVYTIPWKHPSYNCKKVKIKHIDANTISTKFLKKSKNPSKMCPKTGKHELHAILYGNETHIKYVCYSLTSKDQISRITMIIHHAMCSSIRCCSYSHLGSMLMSVKLTILQLELNDIWIQVGLS
jgi:hypothetical protein